MIVLSRKSRSRVWPRNIDRLIFVWIYRLFPSILDAITVVKPETVIRLGGPLETRTPDPLIKGQQSAETSCTFVVMGETLSAFQTLDCRARNA